MDGQEGEGGLVRLVHAMVSSNSYGTALILLACRASKAIPRGTPMAAKFFNEIFPEFKERALSLQKEKLELVAHIARMRLTGPQTKDDFILLYMLASGQVKVPSSVGDIMGITSSSSASSPGYIYGLFNPRRYNPFAQQLTSDTLANIAIPGVDVGLPADAPSQWTQTGFTATGGWGQGAANAANALDINQFSRGPTTTAQQTAGPMGFTTWLGQAFGGNTTSTGNPFPPAPGVTIKTS